MLQKFALAFKTKTIEFFAEEEEEEDDDSGSIRAVDDLVGVTPDAVITDQRVVVLKPDPNPVPINPNPNPNHKPDLETLASTLFATVSSFEAAYLHLQTARSPLLPAALRSADANAVSYLRRLSDLKHSLTNANPINSYLEAQVLDNQSLLRTFDSVINRLQSDIDRKDGESTELRQRLSQLEAANGRLATWLDRACAPPPGEENVQSMLSVGVFDSVLRDSCRITHRFAKYLADLMRRSGWDLGSVARSIYPNVSYTKPGHCRYSILSHVCLSMFDGFDSYGFGHGSDEINMLNKRDDSLRQFIEHSAADPLELISASPDCEFAQFCDKKYKQVVQLSLESKLLGEFGPSSPLYESFVVMASSIWALHSLAWAYDPTIEIFQISQGADFSIVYMENILRKKFTGLVSPERGKVTRPKVGFTVIPGFRVGGTVIQCRVYLDSAS